MRRLFLSHRLDLLAEHLAEELDQEEADVFTPRFILVPNPFLKQWLGIELTKKSKAGGIANNKIVTLQEGIGTFFPRSEFTEIFLSLYQALATFDDPEVSSFVKESSQKLTELSIELSDLFVRYGYFYPSLFQEDPECQNWQKKLIQKLFVKGALRAPFQGFPPPFPLLRCFGFDFLPEPIWKAMQFRSIYLFSPCRFFWEDLCSNRERKSLLRFFEKKGVSLNQREELDSYLRDAPPLLANFGKAGRETLKVLDSLDYQMVEDYGAIDEKVSNLQRLQNRLLNFETKELEKRPEDSSVQLSKVGSSLLKEIEYLRNSILQLVQEKGLLFSEIAVLAPDIQPYAPFIRFVFADLPFRIFDVEIGSKSSFYQGLKKLCRLEWNREDLIRLFENPSFCRARNWDEKTLEWIREALFEGIDNFEETLLQRFVFLSLDNPHRIAAPSSEMLSECIEVLSSLRDDLVIRSKSHSLKEWANFLKRLIEKYLKVDPSNEADTAALRFFEKTMREFIRLSSEDTLFSFASIEALLKRQVFEGQIHASSLHAIRFGSLHEGALTPTRALFLIGMDEEHFPRSPSPSSLDFIWQEKKLPFNPSDQDRYLFLKAIFTATQFLHISYAHLALDGRPMNPSYVVEEFLSSLDAPVPENCQQFLAKRSRNTYLPWQETPSQTLPEEDQVLSLSDLASLARHPWSFYLQKKFGIWIESPEEKTFSQEKAKKLRSSFQQEEISFPHGMYGEALKGEVKETQEGWEKALHAWDIQMQAAFLKMSCREKKPVEAGWEFPPLEVILTKDLRIQIIGEIKNFSSKGFVHFGKDSIEGLLRVWPECLVSSLITGSSKIYCLQSKSVKELSFPEEALKAFLSYYFLSLSAPSPLLADLADPFLRKGSSEWEKKIRDKQTGKGMFFEDPVFEWVCQRTAFPPLDQWASSWEEPLRHHFSALSSLYPSREQPS